MPKKHRRCFEDTWEPVPRSLNELATEEPDPQDAPVRTESTLGTAWLQWMKDSPVDWRRSKVTVADDLLDVKKVQPAADQTPAGVVVVRNDTHMIMRVSREKSQRQKKGPASGDKRGREKRPACGGNRGEDSWDGEGWQLIIIVIII